jgi:hypothetical protein
MTVTAHENASCTFLNRVIEERRQRTVSVEFLYADLVDEARGSFLVSVLDAVALHSHCAPDSLPDDFYFLQSFRNSIHLLLHGRPEDSPRQALWLNVRRSVQGLRTGELRTVWAARDVFGRPIYNQNTPVELQEFYRFATLIQLPVAGPWTVRGESAARPIGYVATFAARPHHADAMEGLSRDFGDELAAGCPHGHKAMKRYCMEVYGLGPTEAARLVAEMDPRPERRGRPAGD